MIGLSSLVSNFIPCFFARYSGEYKSISRDFLTEVFFTFFAFCFFYSSTLYKNLFLPFFNASFSTLNLHPWAAASFNNLDNSSFPYGLVTYLFLSPFVYIGHSLSSIISYPLVDSFFLSVAIIFFDFITLL